MENETLLEELGKLQQTELTLGEVRNAKGFEAAIEEINRLKKESAYWEFKATCYAKDCQKIQADLEESRKTLSMADINGNILDLSDQLLQPRGWDDANWRAQSIEVASLMYRAATQLRILLRSVQTLESQYGVILSQRDEARRLLKAVVDMMRDNMAHDATHPHHLCDFIHRPDIGMCKVCEDWTDAMVMCYPDDFQDEEDGK